MSAILLDTDVLIDHLRGHHRLDLANPAWTISVVTRCELFSGRNSDEKRLSRVLSGLEELPVDRAIAQAAGRIRRAAQLHVADALIAATALEHDLPIMTRNRRHFERVPGLTLRAPEPTRRDRGTLAAGHHTADRPPR